MGKNKTPFKPLVLRAKEFQTKTPARFKRKPEPLPPRTAHAGQLTRPQVQSGCRRGARHFTPALSQTRLLHAQVLIMGYMPWSAATWAR
jgi:hypothetical protein